MQTHWNPAWIWAAAGSMAIHALVAAGWLLTGSDWLGWLRPGSWGMSARPAVTLSLARSQSEVPGFEEEPPGSLSEKQVQEQLAGEWNAARQLTEQELREKLDQKREALQKIPGQHLGQITNVLEKWLPAMPYTFMSRTNPLGETEYVFSFTNASGQKEEFIFDEEDRRENGLVRLLEDPLFAPLLRFALPLAEGSNAPPRK